MSIQLADRSIKYPIRVYKNLLVKISKFIFPADFVVLEIDKDKLVQIILGRPFLATARAIVDVHKRKLSLRVKRETVTFNIGKSLKSKHSRDDYLYYADHIAKLVQEQWVDTIDHDGEWTKEEEGDDPNKVFPVFFYLRTEPMEPLEWKSPKNRLKPSSMEPPKLELKELSKHLEYAFLQENNQLQVVISSALSFVKKTRLLEVVPKKGGMTIVKNEKDELIPQWTVTGCRLAEYYPSDPSVKRNNNSSAILGITFGMSPSYSTSVLTESYEDAWPEMRQHKLFDNVTMDHLEDIITSPPPQEKSLRPAFTGHISFAMHASWSRSAMHGIDFLGPFPLSNENKYVPVAIDYISKWVEARAFPTNDAQNVVNFLKRLFARFGIPKAFISDKGTDFCNHQMEKAMKRVVQRFSTAYHPQASLEHEPSNKAYSWKNHQEQQERLINELDEMRLDAYESSISYKERKKRWHDKRIKLPINYEKGDMVIFDEKMLGSS
nr:hypothetical protein [Tanacetum cinerariifolium]